MRDSTKWVIAIVILAFVGLMVFEWGMDLSGRTSAQAAGGEMGRVNGQSINYEDYLIAYRNLYEQQQQGRETPISTAENRQIEEATWEQLVTERLIQQEMRRRGVQVTTAEIRQAARYAPPPQFYQNEFFQTNGQFDINKYHQFLASSGDTELLRQLEAYYRDLIPRSKLYQQVTAGTYVSDAELWRMWLDRRETARVRYARVEPGRVAGAANLTVSDDEIRRYYNANKADFGRPAEASVRYVVMDRAPLAEDTAASLEHARAMRREIAGGADFAEVARRESADPSSGPQGGDLGTFAKGQMVPAFDQAVWSAPIGQVTEPVPTQFGYHLIRVARRSADSAQASHILIPIQRSDESEDRMLDRADSLESLGERYALEEAAQPMGLRVRTSSLSEAGGNFLPGIGAADEGADWALEEAEPGDVSPLFETPEAYYMVELVQKKPERTLPLQEATPEIRSRLLTEKRLARATGVAAEISQAVRGGAALDQAATSRGAVVAEAGPFTRFDYVPGLGRLNAALGTAFGLAPGRVSEPVVADGNVFVIRVLERTSPSRAEFETQRETMRVQMTAALEQQRWEQFLVGLREDAKVEDLRNELLRQQDVNANIPLATF